MLRVLPRAAIRSAASLRREIRRSAPDVTTNSWLCPPSEGCTTTSLLLAAQVQRAAGIVTVVAAGNDGSGCSTIYAPCALYDEVYTVGAHRWDDLSWRASRAADP